MFACVSVRVNDFGLANAGFFLPFLKMKAFSWWAWSPVRKWNVALFATLYSAGLLCC